MKQINKKRISIILSLLVFVTFGAYFIKNYHSFKSLIDVNVAFLFAIAISFLFSITISGIFTKVVLELFDKYLSLFESFKVSLIATVGNFFAPAGAGFGFRAIYLKRNYNLPYSYYISILSGNYIIVFLVNAFFGLLAMFLLRDQYSSQYIALFFIFCAIFIITTLLTLLKPSDKLLQFKPSKGYLKTIITYLQNIVIGWAKIIHNKKLLLKLITITIMNFLLTMLIAKLEMSGLKFTISFPSLLLFSVLGSLSLFINLTPANLGVKEAVYIFSSNVIGLSTNQILSIALIDRGVLFVLLFILWIFKGRLNNIQSDVIA
jgi:uncharacterized membrane protein YbhN (UPF0104 family)